MDNGLCYENVTIV